MRVTVWTAAWQEPPGTEDEVPEILVEAHATEESAQAAAIRERERLTGAGLHKLAAAVRVEPHGVVIHGIIVRRDAPTNVKTTMEVDK
jgi:hypothetical protein